MIIAIDGPAGAGKSSVAKEVAHILNFHFLDTGAMYRAIAWLALHEEISLDDEDSLSALTHNNQINFLHEPNNPIATGIEIAGHTITEEIRTPEIDKAVTPVCKHARVRDALVKQQRAIASEDDIVIEGRDIGTVVFPNAEIKIFLTASPE